MAVPLRDRVKKAIEFIISMPFVYWAVSYEWSNKSMAWDYVVRGLISILISGVIVIVGNALWALCLAPSKVFYEQRKSIENLRKQADSAVSDGNEKAARILAVAKTEFEQSLAAMSAENLKIREERDAFIVGYESLKAKLAFRQGTPGDVIERFKLLTREARNMPHEMSKAGEWYGRAKACAEECLRGVHAAEIEQPATQVLRTNYTNDEHRAHALLNAISDWLNGWETPLRRQDGLHFVNPDFKIAT